LQKQKNARSSKKISSSTHEQWTVHVKLLLDYKEVSRIFPLILIGFFVLNPRENLFFID
jgi:hypothetical protein